AGVRSSFFPFRLARRAPCRAEDEPRNHKLKQWDLSVRVVPAGDDAEVYRRSNERRGDLTGQQYLACHSTAARLARHERHDGLVRTSAKKRSHEKKKGNGRLSRHLGGARMGRKSIVGGRAKDVDGPHHDRIACRNKGDRLPERKPSNAEVERND